MLDDVSRYATFRYATPERKLAAECGPRLEILFFSSRQPLTTHYSSSRSTSLHNVGSTSYPTQSHDRKVRLFQLRLIYSILVASHQMHQHVAPLCQLIAASLNS
jgi:hypothetical protein